MIRKTAFGLSLLDCRSIECSGGDRWWRRLGRIPGHLRTAEQATSLGLSEKLARGTDTDHCMYLSESCAISIGALFSFSWAISPRKRSCTYAGIRLSTGQRSYRPSAWKESPLPAPRWDPRAQAWVVVATVDHRHASHPSCRRPWQRWGLYRAINALQHEWFRCPNSSWPDMSPGL